jgi:hypothetical protein
MSRMAFDRIVQAVRSNDYHVPRDYQTIGGMWTVDTWRRDGITVQLLDEGYTTRILASGLDVSQTDVRDLVYQEGDTDLLIQLAGRFQDAIDS